jgi:hypothetical protein
VSADAGDFLHFSAGGNGTLHWSLGPELFSVAAHRRLRPPARGRGSPSGDARSLAKGRDASGGGGHPDRLPGRLRGSVGERRLHRGADHHHAGDEVIENGTLVVEGNRIVAVGPAARWRCPAGAHVVDASGRTIMPGIIDVHWHGEPGPPGDHPERNRINYVSLAFGVTTIHDPSTNSHDFFTASEMARSGAFVTAPRLFATGQILYGATTAFTAEVNSLDDARQHLRRLGAMGAISVKSYNQPRRDQRQQLLQAAIEEGIMVVPEGGATFMHNLNMVADGHTGVEHSLSVENVYDDVIQYWSQTEVGLTPTLVVAYGGLWGEEYWYSKTNVWENERLLQFSPTPPDRGPVPAADAGARRGVEPHPHRGPHERPLPGRGRGAARRPWPAARASTPTGSSGTSGSAGCRTTTPSGWPPSRGRSTWEWTPTSGRWRWGSSPTSSSSTRTPWTTSGTRSRSATPW